MPLKQNIIFENNDIVIVNKPAGISAIEEEKSNSILMQLRNCYSKEITPITSLDNQASGLVVFAKNKSAYEFVSEQFKQEKVKKVYHILVNGELEEQEGTIDKNLIVSLQNTVVSQKGIKSITKYKRLEQFKNYAFVEVYPLTTRKHQIRAHFWSIGNPLAIDEIYATAEPILLSQLKRRYKGIEKEKPLLNRLPLHLSKIEFVLPNCTNTSIFEASLEKDFLITIKQLKKFNKK